MIHAAWLLLIIPVTFFLGAFWGALAVLRHCRMERKKRIENFINEYHTAN